MQVKGFYCSFIVVFTIAEAYQSQLKVTEKFLNKLICYSVELHGSHAKFDMESYE